MHRNWLCRALAGLMLLALLIPVPAAAEFGFGLSLGGYNGDRLYSASSVNSRIWRGPTGDVQATGTELLVDLESWLVGGLTAWAPVTDRFGIKADLSFTEVDVDGKVRDRTGSTENVQWDQILFIDLVVQGTWRFGRSEANYPYVSAGASFTTTSSEGNSLDQNSPGLAWGAGWRIGADQGAYVDFAVRGLVMSTDFGDEEGRLAADEFDGNGAVNSIAGTVTFGYVF